MCCVQHRQKQLLITTRGFDGGVYGYNTGTGELEWRMKCKLPGVQKEISPRGVTTDGRSNLYVCDDSNECIQLFSVDGVYNGAILKDAKPSLGEPIRIRWCFRTSSMVVAHLTNEFCRISKIQGTAEGVPGMSTEDLTMQVDLTDNDPGGEPPQPSTSTADSVILLDTPTEEVPEVGLNPPLNNRPKGQKNKSKETKQRDLTGKGSQPAESQSAEIKYKGKNCPESLINSSIPTPIQIGCVRFNSSPVSNASPQESEHGVGIGQCKYAIRTWSH